MKIKISIIALLCVSVFASADVFKRYQVKSGLILYDVSTMGTAPGLTTKTDGLFKLVFDDWGAKELKEEDLTEIQTGDFYDKRSIHSLTKLDYGTVYTVNYEDNTTYQTRDKSVDMAIAKGVDMSGQSMDAIKEMKAKKIGTDIVAGHECDLWQLGDQTTCMYQGIPLSISINADGFTSTRIAQVVKLNEPISDKDMSLPPFPVISEDGYKSNEAATVQTNDYMQAIKNLKKDTNLTQSSNDTDMTQQQINTIIDTIGAPYLKRQKKYLPTLLERIESAKECIGSAEDSTKAKECIKPVDEINDKMGDSAANYDYRNWGQKTKDKILESMNKETKDLKITIDCVNKSKLTTEVIICTEGSLKPQE